MKDIEHFGFIQFYTDNWSVEQNKSFVFWFFEAGSGACGIFQ